MSNKRRFGCFSAYQSFTPYQEHCNAVKITLPRPEKGIPAKCMWTEQYYWQPPRGETIPALRLLLCELNPEGGTPFEVPKKNPSRTFNHFVESPWTTHRYVFRPSAHENHSRVVGRHFTAHFMQFQFQISEKLLFENGRHLPLSKLHPRPARQNDFCVSRHRPRSEREATRPIAPTVRSAARPSTGSSGVPGRRSEPHLRLRASSRPSSMAIDAPPLSSGRVRPRIKRCPSLWGGGFIRGRAAPLLPLARASNGRSASWF